MFYFWRDGLICVEYFRNLARYLGVKISFSNIISNNCHVIVTLIEQVFLIVLKIFTGKAFLYKPVDISLSFNRHEILSLCCGNFLLEFFFQLVSCYVEPIMSIIYKKRFTGWHDS